MQSMLNGVHIARAPAYDAAKDVRVPSGRRTRNCGTMERQSSRWISADCLATGDNADDLRAIIIYLAIIRYSVFYDVRLLVRTLVEACQVLYMSVIFHCNPRLSL